MVIKETNRLIPNGGISISYGVRAIESIESPSFSITEDDFVFNYEQKPRIEQSEFLRFSFYTRNLANNISTHINWDLFNLSEEIKGWNLDLTLAKHIGIIPEFIYLTPGLGFGFASCKQEINSDFLDFLGDNEGNKLRATSWYVAAKLGARILIKNLILFADLGYNNMNFDEWKYEYKEDSESDEYVASEWIKIDKEYVPYPELKSPISIDIGFAFEF